MYKLSPNPKYIYNAEFIAEFQRKDCTEADLTYPNLIKGWWRCPSKFRADTHKNYATAYLNEYMVYVAMMLCRLFGKKNPYHFPADWVPFLEEASEGYSFNWSKILFDNLTKDVSNYKATKSQGQPVAFYMLAYIMDAIFFFIPFPLMNWNWSITYSQLIHEYHSELWEENAKNSFYEICHFVIIPMHKMLYGCDPPRISEIVSENLRAIADWFIEESFSYIRVYGCSVPPHALPKFLPDRLVLREVAHQIVKGGIEIELKAAQKKSWSIFPVHIGKFSLLSLGHSKVEAEALEEIKMVNIEHKKHDPYQLVNNHLIHCGMKAYEHKRYAYDDMFKEVKTYEEVLNRVQALPPDLQTGFMTFQSHRRSCLPKILQGQYTIPPPEQEGPPPSFESDSRDKVNTKENLKETKMPSLRTEVLQIENSESGKGKELETSPEILENFPEKIGGTVSTKLGSPITSLTPLQSTYGNPQEGALYVSDLEPISRDEIPSSDYFFSKKRKAILKQEMHLRGDTMIKKHKIIVDGQNLEEGEFATEIAGTMRAFASTNLHSVSSLRIRLQQKDQMIAQLQSQLKETKRSISLEINKGLERAKTSDIQEIQILRTSLNEVNMKIQAIQAQVLHQEEMNKQLQNKMSSIQNQVVEMETFQARALEIHAKIEKEQQGLISKLEINQTYFHETSKSFDNILLKEREAKVARTTFQKAVILSAKEEIRKTQKLYVSEKIKGDIILKVWEASLAENKRITKEVNDDCQEIFDLLDKASLNIGRDNCPGLLGQINIGRHQLNFKENMDEIQIEISQIKVIDVTQINRWMVKPNLKLQTIEFTGKIVDDHLLGLQRKFILF
jgi:hypothetical protein